MSEVAVEHLTKDYGLGRGVFDVSFSIEKGEVFGFLGPNGAGKSTTIRHLMGFSKSDSGSTKILGKNTFKNYYNLLSHVGYLPGEIVLPEGLTGTEFIKMMKDLRHLKSDKKTKELIERFKLDPSGETKEMSLGQKRKLAVVVAFMHDPDILILDEPTSGLDPLMQNEFIKYIKEEKEKGKTILLSNHIFSEVDATCDRIAIIKDGHLVDNFIASELKHNKTKVYVVKVGDLQSFNAFDDMPNVEVAEKDEEKGTITIKIDEAYTNDVIQKLSQMNIQDLVEEKISLQDYFMKFYKEDRSYVTVNR